VGQVKKKENGWHIGQPFSLLGQAKIRRVSGFWFLVSGFWFLVSGFWFLVSGFKVYGLPAGRLYQFTNSYQFLAKPATRN
jgi:hypothetical protein